DMDQPDYRTTASISNLKAQPANPLALLQPKVFPLNWKARRMTMWGKDYLVLNWPSIRPRRASLSLTTTSLSGTWHYTVPLQDCCLLTDRRENGSPCVTRARLLS